MRQFPIGRPALGEAQLLGLPERSPQRSPTLRVRRALLAASGWTLATASRERQTNGREIPSTCKGWVSGAGSRQLAKAAGHSPASTTCSSGLSGKTWLRAKRTRMRRHIGVRPVD